MVGIAARLLAAVALLAFTRVKPAPPPAEYWQPTPAAVLAGDMSFYGPGLLAGAAENRGFELSGYAGAAAMMRRGDVGREVWILVGDRWLGPLLVVDCAQRGHYSGLVAAGRVIEISWAEWQAAGLPLDLVPVVVSFVGPWPAPAVAWQ